MDARDLLLSTDYPLDQVVGTMTGSISVSNFSSIVVPHNLGFMPLTRGKWSTNSGFSTSYDPTNGLSPLNIYIEMYANATNLVVNGINMNSGSATVYYRVYFLMPSNVNVQALPTQSSLDTFNLNTDYNYTKLLLAGVHNSGSGSVSHNLGYYPQVEVWKEADGFARPVIDYTFGDNPYSTVSTSSVSFVPGVFETPERWHYRIYAEEL